MSHRILSLLLLMLLVLPVLAFADEPRPEDFASGMTIEGTDGDALYELPIPTAVYQGMTRPDHADLCIFNAQREMVPFAMKVQRPEQSLAEAPVALPMFPIMGNAGRGVGGVSLQVKRDESGSIINVSTSDRPEATGKVVVAYLLDASEMELTVAKLILDTAPMPEGEIARIDVEYSNDLNSWYTIVNGATIAELNYGGHTLSVRDIELGRMSAKFYRVSPTVGGTMITVNGVSAEPAMKAVELMRNWLTMNTAKSTEERDAYTLDTGGTMPVDRLRVRLPQNNTIAKVEFLSRNTKEEGWRLRSSAVVYGLNADGAYLASPDVSFAPTTDRYWLMRVEPGTGGIGGGLPSVDVGWIPGVIVFTARGASPFMLAYGSGRAFPNDGSGNYLLGRVDELRKQNVAVKVASPGDFSPLGGESALTPGKPPFNLKKLVLWAILISGVLFLAGMSVSLYKRMSRGQAI